MEKFIWEQDTYRYVLGTIGEKTLIFIGLNPSTAIPKHPDTTWNILNGICDKKGYDSLMIVNLYPKLMKNSEKYKENDDIKDYTNKKNFDKINELFNNILIESDYTILCGWGNDIMLKDNPESAIENLKKCLQNVPEEKIKCLGITKEKHPISPLARIKKGNFKKFDLKHYLITSNV